MTTNQMEDRIKSTFPNCDVAVIDLTGTSNHFEIRINEESLNSLSRVQRHQTIMKIFAHELQTGEVHAMSIKTINL